MNILCYYILDNQRGRFDVYVCHKIQVRLWLDLNFFLSLTDMESLDCLSSSSSPIKSTTPSPNSKQHSTPGSKSPGYTQTRKPAGGSSRPLPSPGKKDRRDQFVCFALIILHIPQIFFYVSCLKFRCFWYFPNIYIERL